LLRGGGAWHPSPQAVAGTAKVCPDGPAAVVAAVETMLRGGGAWHPSPGPAL